MGPFYLLLLLLLLLAFSSTSSSNPSHSLLRTFAQDRLGRGRGRGRGGANDDLFCDSWRLSVETNNAGSWQTIPCKCLDFVEAYVNGDRFLSDSEVIAGESLIFAETVPIEGDGKDVWIFDIDETLLSNIPYYATKGYGSEVFNETAFNDWVNLARAPSLPASLRLYEELLGLGFQMILLTGRSEDQRHATEQNLLIAGYHSWKRLILREASDRGKTALVYKSETRAELEEQGYRIHGNSGDQWSDLMGLPMAKRSFKLPNPLYYID